MSQATRPPARQAQREMALLSVLNEVTQTLHRTHTLDQIAAITVGALKKYSQSPMLAFYILPSHQHHLELVAQHGFSDLAQTAGARLPLQGSRDAAQQIGELIDSLLALTRLTRHPIKHSEVNLSKIVSQVIDRLRSAEPARAVKVTFAPRIIVHADPLLISSMMEHLLGNAWKFSSRTENAQIEFGVSDAKDFLTFFVRDNGVGFDMQYVKKLFGTIQRLHHADEFPGIGVGLAIWQRILRRHGGRIWAESEPGCGATFHFTPGGQQ